MRRAFARPRLWSSAARSLPELALTVHDVKEHWTAGFDQHDLAVGGSGMLAALCVRLAHSGRIVSVIARDGQRLTSLARDAGGPGRIVGLPVDYRDRNALHDVLDWVVREHGTPSRTIRWMHEELAPHGPFDVAEHIGGTFWHVMSSAADDPAQPHLLDAQHHRFRQRFPALDYRQVVLGFVIEADGRSRWHTIEEISRGVSASMASGVTRTILGTTRPWVLRP